MGGRGEAADDRMVVFLLIEGSLAETLRRQLAREPRDAVGGRRADRLRRSCRGRGGSRCRPLGLPALLGGGVGRLGLLAVAGGQDRFGGPAVATASGSLS